MTFWEKINTFSKFIRLWLSDCIEEVDIGILAYQEYLSVQNKKKKMFDCKDFCVASNRY
jgi:hypothetical protein